MNFFFSFLCLFAAALVQLDRHFLKENDGFCLRTILGQAPFQEKWEINSPLSQELREALNQPYHYLAKGHQSYVFASEDGKHVIKFYRFASHLRIFPWLNHPLSYHFSRNRNKIMAYNDEKLELSFNSYKIAYEQLQPETGVEWVHLNKGASELPKIHLIDQTGNHYHIPLDHLSCVLQKRFMLIFDALETMRVQNDQEAILSVVSSLFDCIAERCGEGIIDKDPVLRKNYGWDGSRVVYIDIGRFVQTSEIKQILSPKEQAIEITPILAEWLQNYDKELFRKYNEILNNMQ